MPKGELKIRELAIIIILVVVVAFMVGCTGSSKNNEKKADYKKISAAEAKDILENESDIILLDVRTEEEYKEQHIEGSILIPDYELARVVETNLPDKEKKILVYCRSGRRSAQAAKLLLNMGYTNVYDFGGIVDWPYETTK